MADRNTNAQHDFKTKFYHSLNEWKLKHSESSALEAILDIFEARRPFFKGDGQTINHILKMMDHLDAGRALVVVRSLAEAIKEIQSALPQIGSKAPTRLKQSISKLIVSCKDYVEQYGPKEGEWLLPLPHIGWGQRIEDFTNTDQRYNFPSQDSAEVFKVLINYIKNSFKNLLQVRINAALVIDCITAPDVSFKDRADLIRTEILSGKEYLESCIIDIERTEQIIAEIILTIPGFKERKAAANNISENQGSFIISSLLNAFSKIRNPIAWSKRNLSNTLKSLEIITDEKLKVIFCDGFNGELNFENELWNECFGRDMDPALFKFALLNSENNTINWEKPFYMTGESLRNMFNEKSIPN